VAWLAGASALAVAGHSSTETFWAVGAHNVNDIEVRDGDVNDGNMNEGD